MSIFYTVSCLLLWVVGCGLWHKPLKTVTIFSQPFHTAAFNPKKYSLALITEIMNNKEVELMPSQFHYKMKSGRKRRSHFDRAVPFFGLILASLGALGIIGSFSSPFSLHGGTLYLLVGCVISLTYSVSLRNYFLCSIPSGVNSLLFEKSLLDILTETSAAAKGYQLISMIPFLCADEIHTLSETLPDECLFLKQKGLVHLLPVPLRDMLYGTQRSLLSPPKESENVLDEKISRDAFKGNSNVFSSFFHLPSFLQEVVVGDSGISTISSPSVVNPVASHRANVEHISMRTTMPTAPSNANYYSAPTATHENIFNSNINRSRRIRLNNTPTSAPRMELMVRQDDFEKTLQDILNKKTKLTTDWVKDVVKNAVVSNAYYIASGGDFSDRLMMGLITVGAVGAAVATAAHRRFPYSENIIGNNISSGSISSNIMIMKRIEHALRTTVQNTITYAVPSMTTLAVASGSMLAVRKLYENRPVNGFSSLLSSQVMLPIARNFVRKLQRSSVQIFTLGRFHSCDDRMFLIAVSAWTLTAFLAVKLHRNVKSLKWIFNVIVQKLIYDCEHCEFAPNTNTGVSV